MDLHLHFIIAVEKVTSRQIYVSLKLQIPSIKRITVFLNKLILVFLELDDANVQGYKNSYYLIISAKLKNPAAK